MKAACLTVFLCTFGIVALAFRLLGWHVLDVQFDDGRTSEGSTEARIMIMVFFAGFAASVATAFYYGIWKKRNNPPG